MKEKEKQNLGMIIPVQPVAWTVRHNDEGVINQVALESTEYRPHSLRLEGLAINTHN